MKRSTKKHIPNTKWNKDRCRQIYEMALLGLTEAQMARILDISPELIKYWKKNKLDFQKALQDGKDLADAKVVANFYQNCLDRWVDVEDVHIASGNVIRTKRKKFIQGDKWAQSKWLSIRQRALWAETQNVNVTNTNINVQKYDLGGLSERELLLLKKMGMKQLTQEINAN